MNIGFVNFYDSLKGYGFIRREKGRDLIFSFYDVNNVEEMTYIPKGVNVKFDIEDTDKGLRAVNVSII